MKKGYSEPEAPWLIEVDGTTYRWTIRAEDSGLELRVLDNEHGGSVLVIKGLSFESKSSDWKRDDTENPLFNTLSENKVAALIRFARMKGWRHDLSDQTFRL